MCEISSSSAILCRRAPHPLNLPLLLNQCDVLFYKYFFCLCVLFTQDAVVIILDVSPSMCQAAPGHATSLETSVKAINMIIQRKVRKFCLTSPRAPGHLV